MGSAQLRRGSLKSAFAHDGIEAAQLIDRDAVHCRFFQQRIAIFCSF